MGRKWIIDVLADLRSFAVANGMPVLAVELQQAQAVAEQEIATFNRRVDGLPTGGPPERRPLGAVAGTGTRLLSASGRRGARA